MKIRVIASLVLIFCWLQGAGIAGAASGSVTQHVGAPSGPRPTGRHLLKGVPPRRPPIGSVATSGNGIDYHNGPVILGTTNVYFIWYGDWSGATASTSNAAAKSILTDLMSNIGGSPYFGINTTYYDLNSTYVSNLVHYVSSTTDNYSHGTSLSDSAVQAVVSGAISSGHLPSDSNGLYFVLTSGDVNETSGFLTQYCGWHTAATIGSRDIKYSFVGDPAARPGSCEQQTGNSPNGNTSADGMASIMAHELEETVTDPDGNAWYDSAGNENGDKCAWTFGTTYSAPNGSNANMTLGSRNYLIQQNWVNAGGGYCALSLPSSTPDFTISANPGSLPFTQGTAGNSTSTINTTQVGPAGSVNLTTSVSPSGPTASLSSNSVAAGGSSTLTVTVGSTVAAGTYTVTVTGTEGTATHSTTVTVNVTAPAPADFSISSNPSSLTFTQGTAGSGTSAISTSQVGSAGTISLATSVSPTGPTASVSPTSVSAGGSSTLTVTVGSGVPAGTYTVTVTGTEGTATHSTSVSVNVTSPPPPGITNGGFESGSFSSWSTSGAAESIVNSGAHSGSFAAEAGSTSPTNGDSNIAQTFTAPSGSTGISFWYKVTCPDTVTYDWATATLKDNTAGTTATLLPKTCANSAWTQVKGSVVAGHAYTITLTSHDDNYSGDPTYTLYDDVILTTNSNDFSISASPNSVTMGQAASSTSTISTAVTSGSAQTVNLSASGFPSGAGATFGPASVTAGGTSIMTISTSASTPAGSYTITVTGTGTSATHTTTVALTVTSPGGGIVNGGFETGMFSGWTTSGASTSIVNSGAHSGTYAARAGATTPTNGDSNIVQTFTVPSGKSTLGFWYKMTCPDTVTYDWATATLRDNTTNTTTTVLAKTCATNTSWVQKTASMTAGHSYTLTLTSHDDNYSSDPSYTLFDDATLS